MLQVHHTSKDDSVLIWPFLVWTWQYQRWQKIAACTNVGWSDCSSWRKGWRKWKEKSMRPSHTHRGGKKSLAVAVNLGVPLQQHDHHRWMVILCWLVFLWLDSQLAQCVTILNRQGQTDVMQAFFLHRYKDWCCDRFSPALRPQSKYSLLRMIKAKRDWMWGTSQCGVGAAASATQHGVTGSACSFGRCLNTKQDHGHVISTLQWWRHLNIVSENKKRNQNISEMDIKQMREKRKWWVIVEMIQILKMRRKKCMCMQKGLSLLRRQCDSVRLQSVSVIAPQGEDRNLCCRHYPAAF